MRSPPPKSAERSPPRGLRGLLFRVLAIGLGLLPFVVLEAALRVGGWAEPTPAEDPFVEFTDARSLFVLSEDGQSWETNPAHLELFQRESFPAQKASSTRRIFCLGGSTVQGRPFAIETSFTTWLELALNAADPSRKSNVINCGGASYASYRLAPMLRELLQHDPDLIIIYSGHNEFLEVRDYSHIPGVASRWGRGLRNLRTVRVARRWASSITQSTTESSTNTKTQLSAEVDALLDYRGGLENYHRDDAWRQGAVAHYRLCLSRMIADCQQAGVPVMIVNPASNLRDCYPFKVANSKLTSDEQTRFDTLMDEARRASKRDSAEAVAAFRKAIAIDDRHAGAHYLLGQELLKLGLYEAAKSALIRAKDEDLCPLRMIEPLHDALFDVASESQTPWVDARDLFDGDSPDGIPGDDLFLDHVHPTVRGHQKIAAVLLERLDEIGFIRRAEGWETRRDSAFKDHTSSLDATYYARGRQRLEGLRLWSQGRANKSKQSSE